MVDEHLKNCKFMNILIKKYNYSQFVVLISIDLGGTTSVGWPEVGRQTNTWAELADLFKKEVFVLTKVVKSIKLPVGG